MTIAISVTHLLSYIFGALALCGAGYLLFSLLCLWRWTALVHPSPGSFTPPISILKSLRGADRAMYEAFQSHCQQDYPEYELIFGVSDAADEAVAEVERLKQEFPERRIELVICPEKLGTNGKVSTLAQMLPNARHGIVLINDSDITVEKDYLQKVAAEFSDPQVGLVTALYRAEPGGSLASQIEALAIATDFAPGVLTARVVEHGIHFALGSTIAMRREVLQKIGGLEPLADYLADDYELGARTSAAGYRVALADTIVETHLPTYGFGGMIEHQLRWARTVRDRRLGGYIGLIFTFGVPWAVASLLLAWRLGGFATLAGGVWVLRLLQGYMVGAKAMKDKTVKREPWLIPVLDFFRLYVWIASFFGNTVTWRGQKFKVRKGKLSPA